MKTGDFHTSPRGGRKVFVVSLIVALVIASFAAVGAFAASATKQQNQPATIGGDQFRDLRFDIDWFTHFKSQPGRIANSADRAKMDQYLSQYALILRAAEGLLAKGSTSTSSNSTSGQAATTNNQGTGLFNSPFWNDLTTEQKMATYLHMLNGLRIKIESIAGSNTTGIKVTGATMSNAGIPITGGSSSSSAVSSATPTTSSSASSGAASSATATATPTTSSSASSSAASSATATATPATSGSGTGNQTSSSNTTTQSTTNTNANQVKLFGENELRDLSFAIDWFNHFRSQPGKMAKANLAKINQYLDRYAAILRAAEALVRSGNSNTTGQASTSSSNSSSTSGQSTNSNNQATGFMGQFNTHWWNNLTLQQKLDVYLGMLRGLRDKIEGGTTNNTTTP